VKKIRGSSNKQPGLVSIVSSICHVILSFVVLYYPWIFTATVPLAGQLFIFVGIKYRLGETVEFDPVEAPGQPDP